MTGDQAADGKRQSTVKTLLRRITAQAALLAAVLLVSAPVHAGNDPVCKPEDLFSGLEATLGAALSSSCASACADGAGCAGAGAVVVALAGVATEAGNEGPVNQFCAKVDQLAGDVTSGTDDANNALGALKNADSSWSQSLQQAVNEVSSDALSVLSSAQCGCAMHAALGKIENSFSSCIQAALCAIGDLVGEPCNCHPVPPVIGDCSTGARQDIADNGGNNFGHPIIVDSPDEGQLHAQQQQGPDGSWIVWIGGNTSGPDGNCSPMVSCYCPSYMTPSWSTLFDDPHEQIFTCDCPTGTHLGGTLNHMQSICLCDGTNKPMQPDNPFGKCSQPWGCPTGQVSLNGTCVTPCPDAGQALTVAGCCDPKQVTSCGDCCAPGTIPDPTTGSCVTPPPPPVLK